MSKKKHVSLVPINAGELGLTQPESQKLSALIKKTQLTQPAPADLQALREMLHDHPQLWQVMGDLVDLSVQIVLGTNNWLSQGIRVSVEAGVRALKQELGYRDAPALEKILIDQIIVTWLQLNKVQIQYETAIETGLSLQSGYWWEHRLSAANARYFRACDTLARVRKLSRPTALQLNIGARQLNLASTSTPPTPAALPSGADDLQA